MSVEPARLAYAGRLALERERNPALWIGLIFAAHVPLALLMHQYSGISTLHAGATLAVGLWWAATRRELAQVAWVGAYITGSEVLWRMTDAQVFWEYGKYVTAAIFLIALIRLRGLRGPALIFVYFALLIPSAGILLAASNDLESVRQQLSFNLSGPFSLMVCAWFFSGCSLGRQDLLRLFAALIAPLVGIATIALFNTLSVGTISFSNQSNLMTSGGFGPNQVSSVLGLGSMLALVFALDHGASRANRVLMFVLVVVFAAQSALTFSRGGLFLAAGSATAASLYLVRDRRSRVRLIIATGLLFIVANYAVLPGLESMTGGTIVTRFKNTSTTGRDSLVQEDLKIWADNPIFGVGPGQARLHRDVFHRYIAAHTEFSRMVAEHGIFGLAALLLLFIEGGRRLRLARGPTAKAAVAAALIWSLLFMLGEAMRLVAPGFMFGLAFAAISVERSGSSQERRSTTL